MINENYKATLFVIYNSQGEVKLTGSSGSVEVILANLSAGDTYHYGDDIAAIANGYEP